MIGASPELPTRLRSPVDELGPLAGSPAASLIVDGANASNGPNENG